MIVKNEASVILRALKSVEHLVDYYCICDTGSTDDTPGIIEEYLNSSNLTGIVHNTPWKDFGHNRTECFKLAKKTYKDSDYLMTLDADEVLVPWKEVPLMDKKLTSFPLLKGDMLYIKTCLGDISYYRSGLFKASLDWEWVGVLHEYPYSKQATETNVIANVCNVPTQDGARSQDPDKYLNDAKVFEQDLEKDPENGRSWFYLAQSYADAKKPELAITPIENAIKYSTWGEEQFTSMLRKARYKLYSGTPFEEVVGDYLAAYQHSPHRSEPLFDIISHYRRNDKFAAASLFTEKALAIPYPEDCILFVESSVYEWRLQDEASLVYHYSGRSQVAFAIGEILLTKKGIPEGDMKRIVKNIKLFKEAVDAGPMAQSCCGKGEKSIVL